MGIALIVVFFAASGFVLTNLNDVVTARAERTTPIIEIAQRAFSGPQLRSFRPRTTTTAMGSIR